MRKRDEHKPSFSKAAKTINFDKIVLEKLEEKSRVEHTTVTNIVNTLCRQIILKDENYFSEMSKYHYLKMQEFIFLKDQAKAKNDL